jgi:hypothetical protein
MIEDPENCVGEVADKRIWLTGRQTLQSKANCKALNNASVSGTRISTRQPRLDGTLDLELVRITLACLCHSCQVAFTNRLNIVHCITMRKGWH